MKNEIKKDLLNEIYLSIYEAVNEDEVIFHRIVDRLSGDQWNFPEHIYSREKVKRYLEDSCNKGIKIDIEKTSKLTGYGRRWIKNFLRENNDKNK